MTENINLTDALKKYFGFDTFKGNQEAIIRNLLAGNDTFVLMPTGGGKSLCYQLPSLIMDGTAIVISPLIALMKNQVDAMRNFSEEDGVAHFINSSLNKSAIDQVKSDILSGKTKLLYVAPESLTKEENVDFLKGVKISFYAVDEAHCISEWGHDFRPEYRRIRPIINEIGKAPVIALTATATPKVRMDIQKNLGMQDAQEFKSSFNRPNLYYEVRSKTNNIDRDIIKFIKNNPEKSGIIYCLSRKKVEELAEILQANGINARPYHAGMDSLTRTKNQDDFLMEKVDVIVATIAFGMGIDKSNVTYVIHYNMPKNIESYYQEAGRAGRDGGEADCILLYSPKDVRLNRFMIENSEGNDELTIEENEQIRERDFERLKYMTFYSTTNDCLRGFILRYFGGEKKVYCGKCSNCLSVHKLVDVTIDAQKIMSCIARTGQRYGKTVICDVLKGSKSEKILKAELNNQSTYGIMKEVTARHIFGTIDFLAEKEYISSDNETEVLKLLPKSRDVLFGRERLVMKKVENSEKVVKTHRPEVPVNSDLLDALKALRKGIASKKSVPAYVIFTDATLIDMCKKCPETPDEMLEVSGVGRTKLDKFGKQFLEEIAKFR